MQFNTILYKETQKGAFFNHKVFWTWIFNAVLHSIVLFWLPMGAFKYGIEWSNGFNGDYLVLGNIVYTCVVITVCLKAGLETFAWNKFIHWSVWGSIGLWFLFLVVYSYFWPMTHSLAANMAGMIELIVQAPMTWLCILFVPLFTLVPDIICNSIKITVYPTETDKVRTQEHGKLPIVDRFFSNNPNLRKKVEYGMKERTRPMEV